MALLRALSEIDSRRLYLGEGCASMFTYCTQVLHLSEGGAYNRIEACRAARRYPVIFDLVESSALTLTAVRLLAPHLNDENHRAVLEAAQHESKREVEQLVAALAPKPDAPTVERRLVATPAPAPSSSPSGSMLDSQPTGDTPTAAADARVAGATHEKFRRAQALLRHAVPTGDAAEILDRALSLLVEHLERQRCAKTSRPRASKPPNWRSRHIAAAVKRQVWRRDGGRCAFVGAARTTRTRRGCTSAQRGASRVGDRRQAGTHAAACARSGARDNQPERDDSQPPHGDGLLTACVFSLLCRFDFCQRGAQRMGHRRCARIW